MTTKTISVKVDAGDSKRTVDILDSAMRNLGKGTKLTADEIAQLTKVARGVKAGLADTANAVNNANKNMAGFGRNAGQVGIQVQQLVGQIQGGQNAFQAFSAQAADIGIVLGAPMLGVLAAFGGALAGTVAPAIFNSVDQMKKFNEQVEQIKARVTLSIDGNLKFSESFLVLAKTSKEATRQLLLLTIEQNKIAQSKAGDALKQQFGDLGGFFSNFGRGANLATDAIRGIAKEAGIAEGDLSKLARTTAELTGVAFGRSNFGPSFRNATQEVIELQSAIAKFQETPNLTTISKVVDELEGIKVNGKFATDSSRELAESVFNLFSEMAQGEQLTNSLNEVLKSGDLSFQKLTGSTGAATTKLNELAEVLQRLAVAEQVSSTIDAQKIKTEQLQAELAIRKQLATGKIDQQTANEEIALQNLLFAYEAKRATVLENEALTKEQKLALIATYDEQEVIAQQVLQQRLTNEAQKGAQDRANVQKWESTQVLSAVGSGLNALANLQSKNFKREKKLRKAAVIVNTASAVMKTWEANGGYPYAIAPAAAMAATGLAQLNAINSASPSGGGGVASPSAPAPAAQPIQPQQQSDTFEILGIEKLREDIAEAGVITADAAIRIIDGITSARRNGADTSGMIGG